MDEVWKDITGYEGRYWVSNLGNVRGYYSYNGLKPRLTNGYYKVCLMSKGKRDERFVHRLVAEHFLPCNGMAGLVVNHKDECKINNLPDNLEWVTNLYNRVYSMVNLLSPDERGLLLAHLNDNFSH